MTIYLFSIIAGAIAFALGIDYLLPADWFTAPLSYMQECCAEQPGWFSILCTILMILLLVNALSPKKLLGGHHHHCHCHDCEEENSQCEAPIHNSQLLTLNCRIKGMTCHHCAANVQKSIASVEGVTKATVSLEEKTAYVEGEFSTDDIRKAVESIGFEIEM